MVGERKAPRKAKRRQRLGAWKPQSRVRRSSRPARNRANLRWWRGGNRLCASPKRRASLPWYLFCGAGGLTRGLENVGIDVRLGVDLDKRCEYPYTLTTRRSSSRHQSSIWSAQTLLAPSRDPNTGFWPAALPCQPFSTYSQGRKASDDSTVEPVG